MTDTTTTEMQIALSKLEAQVERLQARCDLLTYHLFGLAAMNERPCGLEKSVEAVLFNELVRRFSGVEDKKEFIKSFADVETFQEKQSIATGDCG